MELVRQYLCVFYTRKAPLPFPDYLHLENRFENDFWVTQEGECIYPQDMETRHLLNTIRMLHRNYENLPEYYRISRADERILNGLADLKGKKGKGYSNERYYQLWKKYYTYMLLRREAKLRGIEESI